MLEDHASHWRAAASPGGLIGLVLTILSVMGVVTAFLGLTDRAGIPFGDTTLYILLGVSALATVLLLYLLFGYLTIGYRMDASGVRISWGVWSETIPYHEIEDVIPALDAFEQFPSGLQPFWPGYYVGRKAADSATINIVATLPIRRQVLIMMTDQRCYAISPERPMLFMEELARWYFSAMEASEAGDYRQPAIKQDEPAREFVDAGWTTEYSTEAVTTAVAADEQQQRPPGESLDPATEQGSAPVSVFRASSSPTSPLLRPTLLRDPISLAFIVTGAIATIAMIIYILVQYQDIPPSLTFHWNVDGLPGRVGEPREIWILPAIAGLVLLANVGLAWSIALFDRFAARLMLGSTLVVHLVTWIALLMLLR